MNMIVEDITLLDKIGKGSFGEVYYTKRKGTQQVYATKKIPKSLVLQEKIKRYFNNEIYILKNVDHPNIIKLYEIKQTINNFYLVFDFCNGGSLTHCLAAYMKLYNRPFPEEVVQYIMRQTISGLRYLHSYKILHRDLKLDNILVNFPSDEDKKNLNMFNSEIKIIDFGFARYLQNDDLASSVLGSPINMDPQILQKLKKIDNKESFGYDEKADIWSLGTLCYELLIGAPPFDAVSYEELLDKINKGVYSIPNSLKLSKQSISFLNGLLQFDPKQRLGVDELYCHEFLTLDAKKFEKVDLNKLSKQYTNTKELIMSTKDNKMLWFLFETPEGDDPSKISPKMISGKPTPEDKLANKKFNSKEEDIIGSLLDGMGELKIIETKRKETNVQITTNRKEKVEEFQHHSSDDVVNRPISGKNANLKKLEIDNIAHKLIQDTFDFVNKDFFNVEPLLIPICPRISNKIDELEI